GVPLRGHSDTEVLLECVVRRGLEATLEASNGMFALALWDPDPHGRSLARDRLGEKPLFYGLVAGRFVFASELRALQRAPFFDARVDPGAVARLRRRSCVPGPHSIFEGVRRLPPGHHMTVRVGQEPDTPRAF